MSTRKGILPLIVIAQFCCTSLWFAGNAIMKDLLLNFNLGTETLAHLTSAVQFDFILGTLLFAFFNISDRFSPSKVFLSCALLGGVFNLGILWSNNTLFSLIAVRFLTGFCLAGIYPVGMKIASDYFDKGLGKSLGFLVGALVLGTAFPHLLKAFSFGFPWVYVILFTTGLAIVGGLMIGIFVPDGPNRQASAKVDFSIIFNIFKKTDFKAAAMGYFGHMWELYAFWAFIPVTLSAYKTTHLSASFGISLWSFIIIGIGALGCVTAGYLSVNHGAKKIASIALGSSGLCCIFSPLAFFQPSPVLFLLFLIFWGFTVVADSPLFSSLVAQNAPSTNKGTALTIVNCLGFAITIFSIQLLNFLHNAFYPSYIFIFLAIGPALGLLAIWKRK
ncbi:MFS transporter [Echinicola sp. CAU 1574]|uniref:MFS transporter n=1 Tax=Echinicola arenosa TaxID=2774144 RepID=A0ABR9AK47_9BACT|nr:MFS transporter [Echinicola arenosa]MBD8488717.1 MFS transporter [Echinicola arenosa]